MQQTELVSIKKKIQNQIDFSFWINNCETIKSPYLIFYIYFFIWIYHNKLQIFYVGIN